MKKKAASWLPVATSQYGMTLLGSHHILEHIGTNHRNILNHGHQMYLLSQRQKTAARENTCMWAGQTERNASFTGHCPCAERDTYPLLCTHLKGTGLLKVPEGRLQASQFSSTRPNITSTMLIRWPCDCQWPLQVGKSLLESKICHLIWDVRGNNWTPGKLLSESM